MSYHSSKYNVIIIGAGAAGLMAAMQAGKRNKTVLLIEHTNKIAEKIRISGGGRCNFTNLDCSTSNYISQNPHFAKSALASYTPHDFIDLVKSYKIDFHEKTLGQLFCDGSSKQIIDMLVNECNKVKVEFLMNCLVHEITKSDQFRLQTSHGQFTCDSLIIATGGLSIPKLGATDFGYRIAKQFNLNIIPPRPALVPLITEEVFSLSGLSLLARASYNKTNFLENILFTHKGLSGPAILQISSYIPDHLNIFITLDLLPDQDLSKIFKHEKNSNILITNFLKNYLPKRLVEYYFNNNNVKKLTDYKNSELQEIASALHQFKVKIKDTEGYIKAEVTAGGIDTKELSSKIMESLKIPGLYFIGEVVDVTGWLGGYNFQWAWSSGFAAGSYV